MLKSQQKRASALQEGGSRQESDLASLEIILEERSFLLHKKDHNVYFKGFSESQASEINNSVNAFFITHNNHNSLSTHSQFQEYRQCRFYA